MPKGMVWARVEDKIEELVRELASSKGISVSEYVRQLILDDLDKRSVFTDRLKVRAKFKGEPEMSGEPSENQVTHTIEISGRREKP